MLHARLFYTEEILARNGTIKDPDAFRETVFQEYHQRGNRLASEGSIQKLFERFGVSEEEFSRTWNSFEVDQKMRVAQDLARRYSISSVPAIVVNGKYLTDGPEIQSFDDMLAVAGELVALVADAVGPAGMVGGQQHDLDAEGGALHLLTDELELELRAAQAHGLPRLAPLGGAPRHRAVAATGAMATIASDLPPATG